MKKIIIITLSILVLLLGAAVAIPYFFQDRIIQAAKDAANDKLNANLNFEKLDVSLLQNIKSFPNITLVVHKPIVIGKEQFSQDTLVQIEKLMLALDVKSLFQTAAPMKINGIEVLNGKVVAKVDTLGNANWDIVKEKSTTSEPSKFAFDVQTIGLENVNVYYRDLQSDKTLEIKKLNHKATGDFSNSLVNYISSTDIEDMSFYNGLIPFLKNVKLKNESDIQIDQTAKKYILTKNNINLNDLNLIVDGSVQMLEKGAMDLQLNFNTDNNEFKKILSMIPTIYQNNFKDIQTNGTFDLKGRLNGIYQGDNYPKMDISLDIRNGEFKYPSLPDRVSKIQIASKITSPGGNLDNMLIDVSKFSLFLGKDPFDGKLRLEKVISNPHIDLYTKGKLNLSDILKFYPMKDVKRLEGMMNLDLTIKAKQSDVKAKNFSAISAKGTANVKNLVYSSNSVGKPLNIQDITLNFSPQYVDVPSCSGSIGKTDFNIKAKLENFIGYYFSKEGVLKGNMNIVSRNVDVNEFTSEDKEKKEGYVLVPKKIDFSGTADIKQMKYGKMTIENISGGLNVKDEQLKLNKVKADLLGGNAQIDAVYSTVGETKPNVSMQYNINSFDITQVYHFMESAPKLAPIMQYMTGKISSKSTLSMAMTPDMSPNLSTLNGTLSVELPFAKIVNVPALNQIAQVTKLNQLSNLEASNVKTKLTFVNGKAILPETFFKAGNYNVGVSGAQGLDKSIEYKMSFDVPFAQLGEARNIVNGLISKYKIPFLGNVNPETIRLNVNVGGFFDQPKVSLGAPQVLVNGKASDAKTAAVDGLKKAGEDAKNEALRKADSIKNAVQADAQRRLDSIKRVAEAEVNKRAEEVKKKAEDEVNKLKDNIFNRLKKGGQ